MKQILQLVVSIILSFQRLMPITKRVPSTVLDQHGLGGDYGSQNGRRMQTSVWNSLGWLLSRVQAIEQIRFETGVVRVRPAEAWSP
jgi:hypothetical protein